MLANKQYGIYSCNASSIVSCSVNIDIFAHKPD